MWNNVLGFGGRIGRLQYFLCSVGLGILVGLVVIAMTAGLAPHYADAAGAPPRHAPTAMILLILAVIVPVVLWFSLALQAKRFRDIGWPPIVVMPGWIGLTMIDRMIATFVPGTAIAPHSGTVIGLLVSLFLSCALLFWPSAARTGDDWEPDIYHTAPIPEPMRQAPRPAPAAWTPAPAPAPVPTGFGRRGLQR